MATASLLWTYLHPTRYTGVSPPESLGEGIRAIPTYYGLLDEQLREWIWMLSFSELRAPFVQALLWLSMVVSVWAVAYLVSPRRVRFVLVAGWVLVLVLPAVLQGILWGGLGWQGRYVLPLVCATILIAGSAIGESSRHPALGAEVSEVARHVQWAATAIFGLFQGWLVALAMHRYSVGLHESWFTAPKWNPPLGIAVPLTIAGVALGCLFVLLARQPKGLPEVQS